jgi:hypothetical protein
VVEGRPAQQSALRVEENGINVISDAERPVTVVLVCTLLG